MIKMIDAKTLKKWLENNEAILLDVREPAEHNAEAIEGACLLPLADVSKSTLPNCAGKKLVIHCRKGGRGGTACQKLLAEDPSLEIYNLEGGIEAWVQSGGAIKTSGKIFLPLDRQVQLTVGVAVLLASLLAVFVGSDFAFVSAFFGAGLTFAGATGFCGLARVLAKMPWNNR